MPLYFAYGSNMDRAAMAARCPSSRAVGVGRLARHRLVIAREGYASIVRDPRRTVWGLLWDLALGDMPALDRYEGVASRLYVKVVQPVLTPAGPRRALVYVARSAASGLPRAGYGETVLAAAREAGLPAAYLREIEVLLAPNLAESSHEPRDARAGPKVRPRWASPVSKTRET
jgi:gamma-glutamylcyclotransferase (GGCT)/AIG2-like uncharacterized protein YtfP